MYYTQHPTAWRVVVMRDPPRTCVTQDFHTRREAKKAAQLCGTPMVHDLTRTIFVDQT